ncbi:hypothetical protein Tco_0755681 [Tanacetum coccineum]
MSISFLRSQASVRVSFSCWEKAWISPRSRSNRDRGKNRLIKAVRSSSDVVMVPSLSSSSQVFASPIPLMRVKWLPLMGNSFVVSGMVIAKPGVEATTRSAAHIGSARGSTSSELEARVCIQGEMFENGFLRTF